MNSDYGIKNNDLISSLSKDRRVIHSFAETGFDVPKTLSYIIERLKALGVESHRLGRAGVVAVLGSGKPTVMLRADIDALPILEESGESFSAVNGNMHACGHDLHAAMLLGSISILAKNKNLLKGRILFLFQPAEEILKGALDIINSGLIEKYSPDIAFMLHTIVSVPLPVGKFIVSSPGVSAPGACFFEVKIKGERSHGAMPHLGKNAISALPHIINMLENMPNRDFTVSDDLILSFGNVSAGENYNIVAENAVLKGTLRSPKKDTLEKAKQKVQLYTTKIAEVHDCTGSVEFASETPPLYNDANVSSFAYETAKELFGADMVVYSSELGNSGGGSEDFSYYSKIIPSVMVGICAGNINDGYCYPLHNSKTVFDERAMIYGAQMYAGFALNYLK